MKKVFLIFLFNISSLLFGLATFGRIDYLSYFKNIEGFDISSLDENIFFYE